MLPNPDRRDRIPGFFFVAVVVVVNRTPGLISIASKMEMYRALIAGWFAVNAGRRCWVIFTEPNTDSGSTELC